LDFEPDIILISVFNTEIIRDFLEIDLLKSKNIILEDFVNKKRNGIFFHNKLYNNPLLRLHITRFILSQIHIALALFLIIISKVLPTPKRLNIINDDLIDRLKNSYWRYSLSALIFKLEEGYFFNSLNFGYPSMEIGVNDGHTSKIFFKGKKITVASDPDISMKIKKDKEVMEIFDEIAKIDAMKEYPFEDEYFKDIIMVHIVDHIKDIDSVFTQINRVMQKGGNFYFSGYSDEQKGKGLIKNEKANEYSKGGYNTYNHNEWKEILNKHGFKMINYNYLLCGFMGKFYEKTIFLYHANRRVLKFFERIPLLNKWYEEMISDFIVPLCERDIQSGKNQKGVHFWIHAQKI